MTVFKIIGQRPQADVKKKSLVRTVQNRSSDAIIAVYAVHGYSKIVDIGVHGDTHLISGHFALPRFSLKA